MTETVVQGTTQRTIDPFQDGRLVNGNFADYTLPTAEAMPMLRAGIVESNEPNGPYGAKGASETAVCPVASIRTGAPFASA